MVTNFGEYNLNDEFIPSAILCALFVLKVLKKIERVSKTTFIQFFFSEQDIKFMPPLNFSVEDQAYLLV